MGTMTQIEQLARDMLAQIDRDEMRRLEQLYPDCTWAKFFDVERFVMAAADKAITQLGLQWDEGLTSPLRPKRFLDLGSGFGYLPLAAKTLGHEAIALEWPNHVILAVSRCVSVSWLLERITRCEFLVRAARLGPFDLVNMTGVNLVDGDRRFWSQADYEFLIDDVLSMLRHGGEFIIEWNRGAEQMWLGSCDWNGRRHTSVGNRIVFEKE
jgi:SAM-dependent methyltransferase